MNCIKYDNFGWSEHYYNLSGKNSSHEKSMTELRLILTTVTEQTKLVQSKTNFMKNNLNDFKKEKQFYQIRNYKNLIVQ